MLRRQGTSILRSLARTAASSGDRGESSGTGGGLRGRPRGFAAALSAAAAPPSPQAGWDAFAGRPPLFTAPELLPTQSSRRRVPPSQAAKMLLMSVCCLQSPFLPGNTGVHSISPLIRSSKIHVWTEASYSIAVLFTCRYPKIFARPSSGTS